MGTSERVMLIQIEERAAGLDRQQIKRLEFTVCPRVLRSAGARVRLGRPTGVMSRGSDVVSTGLGRRTLSGLTGICTFADPGGAIGEIAIITDK